MISAIGLIAALALLIYLTVRGWNILIAAPIAAALVAATSGIAWMPPLAEDGAPDFATGYMSGFAKFFADWFPMFLLGAIFGEYMKVSGAAKSIARWIIDTVGDKHALLAVVGACAVLTYGGVSVFIVAFAVYPMAVSIFREADLPRRFMPAAITFGSVTFTMTSAGSPEIQNLIPMQYLGTKATAAWEVSLITALLMAVAGQFWLQRMVAKAKANGEGFIERDEELAEEDATDASISPFISILPLIAVLGVFLLTQNPGVIPGLSDESLGKWGLVVALGAGVLVAAAAAWRVVSLTPNILAVGATSAVVAIVNTCAVVGFGGIAKLSPAFLSALDVLQNLPGAPLIGAAIAVSVICGLTGSASGGQTIALPLIAPGYIDAGVDPNELHRVVAISSGALDSLPHNGYVVTTIRAICGETHESAYKSVAALTVIVPLVGLIFAIACFLMF
ncbi:MAG: citrate transporter [Hirschia sp.]|nr:citrate transporter [Hirschia sp.]MBF19617.1 citrate transporter [Hirschia sp.]|tara:strand:+ start:1100 stop:2446 length:1347 start_codon:yes stop_codon:yes gene_type:complete